MIEYRLISLKDGVYHYEVNLDGNEEKKGYFIYDSINQKVMERKSENSEMLERRLGISIARIIKNGLRKEGCLAFW